MRKPSPEAMAFLGSMRGRYIIGQALGIAIAEMEKVPPPHREESNIEDMKFLRDSIPGFEIWTALERVKPEFLAHTQKKEG